MNVQSNIETITEQTQFFTNLSIIFLVIAIALLIAEIIIFIVFKIPHSIRVLTGMGGGKKVKARTTPRDNKATVSWNTSELLKNKSTNEDATTVLDSDETTILENDDETTILDQKVVSDETTVLFEMEDDIRIVGSNQKI
ncbi:hypothetical protein [Pseudobutyrivibrio ruminis]|jgi:hypothetical protein|uniref:hypothetical protein n=1 Tax=Pseudobutyrivibrio ruminis TaxID=46206 RepID=UPI000416C22F|nr:hypothetical protein [Pseudobutyrivibrio ruminis]